MARVDRWKGGRRAMASAMMILAAGVAHAGPATGSLGPPAAVSCVADANVGNAVSRPAGVRPKGLVRQAAQVTRNDRADATFEVRPAPDGGAEVAVRSGGLQVKKTVQGTGEFELDLTLEHDSVTLTVAGRGITVTRGRTRVERSRQEPGGQSAVRIRRLLADSPAVYAFRTMSAALLEANDHSPPAVSMLIADAMVGMLTGDVGAPRRYALFLARGARAAGVRPAALAVDCFTVMEERFVEAGNDYNACYESTSGSTFYQDLCSIRWGLQVESYWFSFLTCSGFNW
jgi:hypothetical protein